MTIVAIDDSLEFLDFIEISLTQSNVKILCFADPNKGWQTIQRMPPDIVILDLHMPEISGMDILQQINQLDFGIDVVLLSAD